MAEAAVSFVVQRLGDLLLQEAIHLGGVRGQVQWLERELRRMRCFLKDADAKRKGDERVKNWVRDIRDVAYEAEDIIDVFMLKVARRRGGGFMGSLKRYVFILDQLIARHKTGAEIESIKARILEISDSRVSYGIANLGETEGTSKRSVGDTSARALVPFLSQLDDARIVGFDKDKDMIKGRLLDQNDKSRSVISIVGMGGLGKTTLARSVYNHTEIKSSFSLRAWVTVSQEYKPVEVVKTVLSTFSTVPRDETENVLIEKLHEALKQSKYLIVLDDVWNLDVWDQLKIVFPDVENGSRVVLTTRFLDVAKYADPKPHELRFLDEKDSWELFLRKAFPKQDVATCCPAELEALGCQLARRCGGLPLALVTIGGLMSVKERSYNAWLKVAENVSWQLRRSGWKRCLDILALSYNDLPYYMKSCFLYLGSYPEDCTINARQLIRLWIAEGFIPATDGEPLEESGEACLEELAQRCMVQVVSRRYDGTMKACRLHDLMREMIISEAKEDGFFDIYNIDTVSGSMQSSNVARRLVVYDRNGELGSLQFSNKKIRSLLGFDLVEQMKISIPKSCHSIFSELKLLRVIDLRYAPLQQLPTEIKSMIHLRYLGLQYTQLKILPSSMGDLRNLQTIDVRHTKIVELPEQLWKIETLRHVFMVCWRTIGGMIPPPKMISKLKNMQNLYGIEAGDWIEHELPMLSNLRKLHIRGVSEVHASALFLSLNKLARLASLSISGGPIPSDNIITAFQNRHQLNKLMFFGPFNDKRQLPSSQVFPPRLVELSLSRSELEIDPMPTLEKLPYLRVLSLLGCYSGKQMTCSAGGFPQLHDLQISYLNELEEWRIEKGAMPCLESLVLFGNQELKAVPEGLQFLTMLEVLKFIDAPDELERRIRKKEGEDWYRIQHVPTITILDF